MLALLAGFEWHCWRRSALREIAIDGAGKGGDENESLTQTRKLLRADFVDNGCQATGAAKSVCRRDVVRQAYSSVGLRVS